MTELLSRIFVKNHTDTASPAVRSAYGSLVSIVGIVLNVILFAAKCTVGVLFGSVSITADAVNNLSDAGSQIISLISFRISSKPADREHPFGHARIEYVASMIVSFLVLLIGVELFKESVSKIFSPELPERSWVAVAVLGGSILVKLWLGIFNKTIGKRIDSSVMRATATDCLSDALSTSAVLISTLILLLFPSVKINLDAYTLQPFSVARSSSRRAIPSFYMTCSSACFRFLAFRKCIVRDCPGAKPSCERRTSR